MRLKQLLMAGSIITVLIACGDKEKTSALPMDQQFKADMTALDSSSVQGAQGINQSMNNAFSKIFGGTSSSQVKAFIEERVKHVYSVQQILSMPVTISNQRASAETSVGDLTGMHNLDAGSSTTLQALNFGAAILFEADDLNVTSQVSLPDGQKLDIRNTRSGLVGLAPGYLIVNKQAIPLEGRIGVLIHEGRHSDCPEGIREANCGFRHKACPSDHDLAGLSACDGTPWGPYYMESVYVAATLNNHPVHSAQRRFLEVLIDDSLSRVSHDHLRQTLNSSPNLTSK